MQNVETPYTIQNLTVKNRILRSATMESMAGEQGFVTDAQVNLYYDLALGGTGLIITGASATNPCSSAMFSIVAERRILFFTVRF